MQTIVLLAVAALPHATCLTCNQLRSPARQPRLRSPALVASNDVLRLGDKWWLTDETERARPISGVSRYMTVVAAVGAFCVGCVARFTSSGALQWTATPMEATTSTAIPQSALMVWRLLCLGGTTVLTLSRVSRSSTGVLEDLDRRGRTFRYSGIWRFQGLTGWSWLLINAYFALTSLLMAWPAAAWAPSAASACQVLLGTASAFALLVTLVVSFVLIPNRHAKGLSVDEYFRLQALCMHNANVAMMAVELWVSGLTVALCQMPLSLLFGLVYVAYHNGYRFARTRTLLYFFLNWTRPDAYRIVGVLLALFGACFGIVYGVSAHLRTRAWGAPLLAAALVAIMRVRRPPAEPPARDT